MKLKPITSAPSGRASACSTLQPSASSSIVARRIVPGHSSDSSSTPSPSLSPGVGVGNTQELVDGRSRLS
ncbi:hypothetical protein FJZ53_03705 [Candidatus Woesearchaeota archaeon]|nr:hypothetical protein [Candidatus Woesearchaeota archaeon]